MPYLVGVDTGGTFTDFALFDADSQIFSLYKHPSTPEDPSEGLVRGLRELLARRGVEPGQIAMLVHGTTVATNAVVEDRLEDIAMVTTAGFRDILELGRQRRPHLYNLEIGKPPPLAPRRLRLEVRERIDTQGNVLEPLDERDLEAAAARILRAGVPAAAICFLHAYRNPAHERRARAVLRRLCPGVVLTVSSDVLREFREYERFATTVLNAALLPVMRRYLDRLGRRVRRFGIRAAPGVSSSFGSTVALRVAKDQPISTMYSGPAAGVVGAAAVASASGFDSLITLDMGGTSTDVCLVPDGTPLVSRERQVAGWPVVAPTLDVHSIGTGGGSVLWMDDGGFLQVGPHSAGARPGPVCYNLGGTRATVTDANVVSQRLSPTQLLGGRMEIFPNMALDAIRRDVAAPLGFTDERAIDGTFAVLTSNLVRAVRAVSVERGHDPRTFTLVGFGGVGPMHATRPAREMGISTVLVPEAPGVLCALGLLSSDVRAEFSQSRPLTLAGDGGRQDRSAERAVERAFAGLERRASRWLRQESIDRTAVVASRLVEASYPGQGHQIPVPLGPRESDAMDLTRLVERFHRLHEERYGYARSDAPVRIVHFRLRVTAPGPRPELRASPPGDGNAARAIVASRRVYLDRASGFSLCSVYWRPRLEPDDRLEGPAIVEQMDATTVLLPGQEAYVDQYRNLVVSA